MSARGRPVRFLVAVTAAWAGMRGLMLWPGVPAPWLEPQVAYAPSIGLEKGESARSLALARTARTDRPTSLARLEGAVVETELPPGPTWPSDAARLQQEMAYVGHYGTPPSMARLLFTGGGSGKTVLAPPGAAERRLAGWGRLRFSGWTIVRNGSGPSLAGVGQLGGSQAGLRASYGLDKSRSVALFGRLASPLSSPGGREAAIGVDWQPLRGVPVRIAAERRQSIDGGRNAFGIGLFGGIDPTPIAAGVDLDAYGQTGVVGARRRDFYIDGALRIERHLIDAGGLRIAVGAGTWGGLQPHAGRLDIGPQIVARIPAGGATLRIGLDWRQRVAGSARPGSGPALSIGTDF